jgi:hypothetical protein
VAPVPRRKLVAKSSVAVAEREFRKLFAAAIEKWIARDHQRGRVHFDQSCKHGIEVAL